MFIYFIYIPSPIIEVEVLCTSLCDNLLFIINYFKDTPVYSTHSYFYVFNSKGLQISYFSITIAPTPSATAGAVAKKYLQDIYKQELKDYKQEYIYKAALNQTTLKVLTASTAQAKLVMEEIY